MRAPLKGLSELSGHSISQISSVRHIIKNKLVRGTGIKTDIRINGTEYRAQK